MRFKEKPEILSQIDKEKKAQSIISAVEFNQDSRVLKEKPWKLMDDASIKEVTVFSLRIPKEELMKLRYVSENKMISMNALCLSAIRRLLNKELREIEKN